MMDPHHIRNSVGLLGDPPSEAAWDSADDILKYLDLSPPRDALRAFLALCLDERFHSGRKSAFAETGELIGNTGGAAA